MPIKIAIDSLPLVSGHKSRGTGVYTKNLIAALIKVGNANDVKIDSFNFAEDREKLAEYDILHYPYFDLFYHTLPLIKKVKTIVTVHDVTPLLYPNYYPPGLKGTINFNIQKLALSRVDAVITVSETSKKDIVRFLNIANYKIHPIYEAPNFQYRKQSINKVNEIKIKYQLPKDYVLYIGDVNWNKNLLSLIKAIKKMKYKLVIVGKNAVSNDFDRDHIENIPLATIQDKYGRDPDILRIGYVPDDDLHSIWQLAGAYCLPSLYEGFGLSAVEAMSAKVPLILSKTQALVEVAQDSAIYFDPHSIDDIAQKIDKVMKDVKLRRILVEKGSRRAGFFSWEKAAVETISVYKKIMIDEKK